MTGTQTDQARVKANSGAPNERVLVLAPVGRDGALACKVLSQAGLGCRACDEDDLRGFLLEGAGAVLLTEEALSLKTVTVLREVLAAQPAWSDLPLVLFVRSGREEGGPGLEGAAALQALGPRRNVTLLERPVRPPTLLTVVQAALRARRRQVEVRDLLARLEERFLTAVHMSPAPTLIVDLADFRLTEVNEAFLQLSGYAREEVVGHTASQLDLFADPKGLDDPLAKLRQKEPAPPLEVGVRAKGGEVRYVLMTGRALELDGETYLLAALTDITEQKRTEEELMSAIQSVMQDTTWFSRSVMERLARIRSGDPDATGLEELTKREQQVLRLLAGGMSNKAIATELGLAVQTVRNYISAVYDKLGVRSRAEAIVWARERGLVGL